MAKSEYEIVVIGGGAAGIAAARRLREAGADALIVEARDRLGGRAWTIADAARHPLDLGCGWLHSADVNPWREIAERRGLEVDRTPPPWSRPQTQTGFAKAEQTAFVEALMRFRDRTDTEGLAGPDRPAAELLEPQERWRPLMNAVSTFYSGVELDRVSIVDLARYEDTGVNWRVPSGYGALIAGHGEGLPAHLGCSVERIDRRGARLRVETSQGAIIAHSAIVTLPSDLIATRPDLFIPALAEKTEAAAGVPLGLADKLFMSLAAPEQFEKDSRCWGRTDRAETAAYHLRPFGRPMIEAFFGGALAAELEKGGERAFFDFAASELAALFGADFRGRIKPIASHGWAADPFARGSYSYALPGKAVCRAALAAPVEERLFFAGEACSRADFSTAHGAYRTGIAAAEQAIAVLQAAAGRAGVQA